MIPAGGKGIICGFFRVAVYFQGRGVIEASLTGINPTPEMFINTSTSGVA